MKLATLTVVLFFIVAVAGTSAATRVDSDNDGLEDYIEEDFLGTNPNDDDTDDDGLMDGTEDGNANGVIDVWETHPLLADTDDDMLLDGLECGLYAPEGNHTDPSVFQQDVDQYSTTDPLDPDTDGDWWPDGFEDSDRDGYVDGDETDPANADTDGDGLEDKDEVGFGCDPLDEDTDDDGLGDYEEVFVYGSEPDQVDSDDDNLEDWEEVFSYGTDPAKSDTDSDGISDGDELAFSFTDPTDPDCDNDGLPDGEEYYTYMTNPQDWDSDDDGLSDGDEVYTYGTDPSQSDSDYDYLSDWDEIFLYGTDPRGADTDGDTLADSEEVDVYGSDPLDIDTDDDWLLDGDEIFLYDSDPCLPDTDYDGLTDYEEVVSGSYPRVEDTDSDGLRDGEEVHTYGSDPTASDTDLDALTDGDEVDTYATDPTEPDSDADLLSDGEEVLMYSTDPTDADSDDDLVPDGQEIAAGTDPLDPESYPEYQPTIISITDIGNDQGRSVRLRWLRSAADVTSLPHPVTSYSVFRRVDSGRGLEGEGDAGGVVGHTRLGGEWELVLNVPAFGDSAYVTPVPTLCDSTDVGVCWSAFFVRAHLDPATIYHDSAPDSGYSIDNLAPAPPRNLLVASDDEAVLVTWDPNEEEDLQYYAVYRDTVEGFEPGEPIGFAVTEAFEDPDPPSAPEWWYRVTAVDFNGNESLPSESGKMYETDVEDGTITQFSVGPAVPNPFRHATEIHYTVPESAVGRRVVLRIYAATGKLMRTFVERGQSPASWCIRWDGRDATGNRAASGVYFYQVECGDHEAGGKLLLVK